ncbi:hypothetical protein C8R44DRAFT_752158 [Mycena epipterygia]|nr:hypothetical protein C8R44DRAFT_752158 [Mycena epipterygia]
MAQPWQCSDCSALTFAVHHDSLSHRLTCARRSSPPPHGRRRASSSPSPLAPSSPPPSTRHRSPIPRPKNQRNSITAVTRLRLVLTLTQPSVPAAPFPYPYDVTTSNNSNYPYNHHDSADSLSILTRSLSVLLSTPAPPSAATEHAARPRNMVKLAHMLRGPISADMVFPPPPLLTPNPNPNPNPKRGHARRPLALRAPNLAPGASPPHLTPAPPAPSPPRPPPTPPAPRVDAGNSSARPRSSPSPRSPSTASAPRARSLRSTPTHRGCIPLRCLAVGIYRPPAQRVRVPRLPEAEAEGWGERPRSVTPSYSLRRGGLGGRGEEEVRSDAILGRLRYPSPIITTHLRFTPHPPTLRNTNS